MKINRIDHVSINVNDLSAIVKRISNIVNGLLHQASMLVNNKFSGSNYADNNIFHVSQYFFYYTPVEIFYEFVSSYFQS